MIKIVEFDISSHLNPKEWKQLKLFCERSERLISTKMVSDQNINIKANISYKVNNNVTYTTKLPPEEVICEFLLSFRFFYSEREHTNLLKILNILGKYASSHDEIKAIKHLKNRWKASLLQESLFISINGNKIRAENIFDIWFNGYYFHQDESKKEELELHEQVLSMDFSKYLLLDSAFNSSKIVFKVYDGIRNIVKEHFKKT